MRDVARVKWVLHVSCMGDAARLEKNVAPQNISDARVTWEMFSVTAVLSRLE